MPHLTSEWSGRADGTSHATARFEKIGAASGFAAVSPRGGRPDRAVERDLDYRARGAYGAMLLVAIGMTPVAGVLYARQAL